MHSMQRPEVFFQSNGCFLVSNSKLNFRCSKATDEDAGKAAYRRSNSFQRFDRTDLVYRRISVLRRIDYQQIGVSDSNVQLHRLIHRRSGKPATGDRRPATGNRRPASRRIRFQRSTQQIGTPANWRTDVSAPNATTQLMSTPANWRTGDRRQATGVC